MSAPILVTGGTGTIGRQVVPLLRDAGANLRVLSRQTREPADGVEYVTGDLFKDEGVEAALDGVETVLHLAGGNKGDEVVARNLTRAAAKAGVQHLVLISVIGADRVPLAWMRTQVATEQAVVDSGVPYTILRAAQFHDPKVYGLGELVRGYLEVRGKRRMTMPVRIPGKAGRAYRAADNLTLEGADHGTRTWEDFLDERLRRTGKPLTGARAS